MREEALANQLKNFLQKLAVSEEVVAQWKAKLCEWEGERATTSLTFARTEKDELASIEAKLDKLVALYLESGIERDRYLKMKDELLLEKACVAERKQIGGRFL